MFLCFFNFIFNTFSVPAIPSLSEVACISVDRTGSSKEKLLEYISKECRVVGKAPVYIADVIERPGALLVKWSEVRLGYRLFYFIFYNNFDFLLFQLLYRVSQNRCNPLI